MSTRSELETFLGAVRFFTRLPVPGTLGQDAPALAKAMRYFPAVGLIVGALAGLAFAVTTLFWPKTLAVLAAMATAMIDTSAIIGDWPRKTLDSQPPISSAPPVVEIASDTGIIAAISTISGPSTAA